MELWLLPGSVYSPMNHVKEKYPCGKFIRRESNQEGWSLHIPFLLRVYFIKYNRILSNDFSEFVVFYFLLIW